MLKIAFLFLTISNPYHRAYWRDFFANHKGEYSLYVHPKEIAKVTAFRFKRAIIPVTVPTRWEFLMNAEIELLREALKDPDNAKFIFISDTTIPLQSFPTVYRTLMVHDKSLFTVRPNPHVIKGGPAYYDMRRLVEEIPVAKQQKHSQWIVLNRKHAEILVQNSNYLQKPIFCDNEHYPGTILAHYNMLGEIARKDTTFVSWTKGSNGKTPFTFTNLKNPKQVALIIMALEKGYLFARKFAPKCDLSVLDPLLPYRDRQG